MDVAQLLATSTEIFEIEIRFSDDYIRMNHRSVSLLTGASLYTLHSFDHKRVTRLSRNLMHCKRKVIDKCVFCGHMLFLVPSPGTTWLP